MLSIIHPWKVCNVMCTVWYFISASWATKWGTVWPRLSGHVGTGAYPDKRFVRIWELCLDKASSVRFIEVIMYLLIAIVFVTINVHINWKENEIKQKFIHFVFVLSKILCGNEWKIDSNEYALQDRGRFIRDIRITGGWITEVRLYLWFFYFIGWPPVGFGCYTHS